MRKKRTEKRIKRNENKAEELTAIFTLTLAVFS